MIKLNRKSLAGGMPKIWRGEAEVLPGSYKLKNMPSVGTVIDRGVLAYADTSKLECTIVRTVKAVENISTTKLSIAKGSIVEVGTKLSNGTTAATVKSIDTSNADKDVLTLDKTIAGVEAGNVLFEATDDTTPIAEPNAVVAAVKEVEDLKKDVIDLAYEANVLKDIASPVPADWLQAGMCLKNNHSIKFFNQ